MPIDERFAATAPIGGIGPGWRSSTIASVRMSAAAAITRPVRRQIRPTIASGRRTTRIVPTARKADPNRRARRPPASVTAPAGARRTPRATGRGSPSRRARAGRSIGLATRPWHRSCGSAVPGTLRDRRDAVPLRAMSPRPHPRPAADRAAAWRSGSSAHSRWWSTARRSSSTRARRSRSSPCSPSSGGRSPATSSPRSSGPSRTTSPRVAPSVGRCPCSARRARRPVAARRPVGGRARRTRRRASTSRASRRRRRPPVRRRSCRRRRRRAARSSPGSRSATARRLRRLAGHAGRRGGAVGRGAPRPACGGRRGERRRRGGARGRRTAGRSRPARRGGPPAPDGAARAVRRSGRGDPPVPGVRRRPRARARGRAARRDHRAVRGHPRRPRGCPGPRPAATAPAPAPVVAAGTTAATPVPLPMVGRQVALASLLDAHRESAPDGRVVVVTGEAGIGKSRLVEAVVGAVAAAGGHALVARAYPAEAGIAYGPVVELLRCRWRDRDPASAPRRCPPGPASSWSGSSPSRPGHPAARRRPRRHPHPAIPRAACASSRRSPTGLRTMVAGDRRAWSRRGPAVGGRRHSRDARLARPAPRGTADPPGPHVAAGGPRRPGHGLRGSLDAVPGVQRIALDRLDRDAVAELVAAAAARGLAAPSPDDLLDESEGLPLFVVEALVGGDADAGDGGRTERAGAAPGPAGLRERDRVQVLAAAAVIGRSFDIGLVSGAAVGPRTRRSAPSRSSSGAASSASWPRAPDVAFDFAHARFRDAAYDGDRASPGGACCTGASPTCCARTPDGRDDPGRLVQVAVHERAAGRDAEAAEAYRDAGLPGPGRATRSARPARTSRRRSRWAIPTSSGIESALGEVRTAQGDYAGADRRPRGRGRGRGRGGLPAIELRLGRVHARRGDPATAASHLDAAIDAARVADDRPARDLLGARPGRAARSSRWRLGDLDLADATAGRALDDRRRRTVTSRAIGAATASAGPGRPRAWRPRRRARVAAQSLELAPAAADPGAAIAARQRARAGRGRGGRPGGGDRAPRGGARRRRRRTGELHLEAAVENNLADQLHAAGRRTRR